MLKKHIHVFVENELCCPKNTSLPFGSIIYNAGFGLRQSVNKCLPHNFLSCHLSFTFRQGAKLRWLHFSLMHPLQRERSQLWLGKDHKLVQRDQREMWLDFSLKIKCLRLIICCIRFVTCHNSWVNCVSIRQAHFTCHD